MQALLDFDQEDGDRRNSGVGVGLREGATGCLAVNDRFVPSKISRSAAAGSIPCKPSFCLRLVAELGLI